MTRWESRYVSIESYLADFLEGGSGAGCDLFLGSGNTLPRRLDRARERDLETAVGIALRAAVKPNVVGRVELGVGREGPAAFVGIDYPFQVFFPSYSIIT